MAHSVGDSVWSMTTFVEFDGRTRCHVHPAEVVGVIHDIVLLKSTLGSIRPVEAGSETICDSEAEAWAAAARELLGDKPTPESVADCLWAIVMLPEFQLIR